MTNATETTAFPDFRFGTFEERLKAHCAYFDSEAPEVSYDEGGKVLMTDGLLEWCNAEGASLDWLLIGDPKGITTLFRERAQSDKQFVELLAELDEVEKRMLVIALRAAKTLDVTVESILKTLWPEVTAHRASKSAA